MSEKYYDLKAMQPLEAAIKAQREYLSLNAELKVMSKRREFARERLIASMEAANRTDDGNEFGKAKLTKKMRNRVTDFEALREYVYNLNEPVSAYLKEVFIKGVRSRGVEDPLDRLVKKAAEQALEEGKSVEECLPPGLSTYLETSLRITLRKSDDVNDVKTASKFADLDAELEE